MEAFCLAPIDVIKTRLQLDHARQYRSIVHCGATIVEKEGVSALWKGVVPFATHLTAKYALRMGSNSFYQNLMRDEQGHLNNYRRLAAGAMAGVTEAVCIVTPFEVVKIRLQQQRGMDKKDMKYKARACSSVLCLFLFPDCATRRLHSRSDDLHAHTSYAEPATMTHFMYGVCARTDGHSV